MQIVTADGNLRWADDSTEPDLLWALRGGGPNFGVVTALRTRLAPAAEVYGGSLLWPVQAARQVLEGYRDWVAGVPRAVTSAVGTLHLPDAPFVPEPMRGRSVMRICLCHAGPDLSDAEEIFAPLRAIPGLVADLAGPMPYTRIDDVTMDPVDPLPYSLSGQMISGLSDEVIDLLVEIAPRDAEPYLLNLVRHLGGAPHPAGSGLGYWSGDFALEAVSVTPDPASLAAAQEFAARLNAALGAARTGYVPLNFASAPDQVRQAYTREHGERLTELKKRFDPGGMFGGDRPISPR